VQTKTNDPRGWAVELNAKIKPIYPKLRKFIVLYNKKG
jgi:hypothetical protein